MTTFEIYNHDQNRLVKLFGLKPSNFLQSCPGYAKIQLLDEVFKKGYKKASASVKFKIINICN